MAFKNGLFEFQENWENLANAIIIKSADDYRYTVTREKKLLKKLANVPPASPKALSIRKEIETVRWDRDKIALFFKKSPWFVILGDISGTYVLGLLEEEAKEVLGQNDAV